MEMAPLHAAFTPQAAARADLLVALCGKNALIAFERVFKAEVARVVGLASGHIEVLTTDANWFPEYDGALLPPVTDAMRTEDIKEVIRKQAGTRAQRRQAERKLFKNGRATSLLRTMLPSRDHNFDTDLMRRSYPMLPDDAQILSRYAFGHATKEEASEALLNGMRNPSWMMRWFAEHHDTLSPIIRWIRGPSEKYLAGLQPVIELVQEVRHFEEKSGKKLGIGALTPSGWKALQDDMLLKLANKVLETTYPECPSISDPQLVADNCPALSTMVHCIYSTAWDALRVQPRTPKASDFADALHALYAPYVSIFRADGYMAPHIEKHVKQYGTKVVSKLRDLPQQIEYALR